MSKKTGTCRARGVSPCFITWGFEIAGWDATFIPLILADLGDSLSTNCAQKSISSPSGTSSMQAHGHESGSSTHGVSSGRGPRNPLVRIRHDPNSGSGRTKLRPGSLEQTPALVLPHIPICSRSSLHIEIGRGTQLTPPDTSDTWGRLSNNCPELHSEPICV